MSIPTPLVLIITDNTLAESYTRLLAQKGIESRLCTDGNHALQEALDHKPSLVLLDLSLPHVSSFDLLDILRSTPETAHTKVILLGNIVSPADLKRVRELGARRVFIKSHANVEEVVSAINHELQTAN